MALKRGRRKGFGNDGRPSVGKPVIAAAISVMVLAACGKADEGVSAKNAAVDEVREKVAAAARSGEFMAPGQWKGAMKVTNLSFPEEEKLPAAMRDPMKDQMAKGHSLERSEEGGVGKGCG